ncbi:MAG: prepilin-type N-terminal cleavage/methylation domain-containing protein [Desulfatiglandales bacterium]
MIYRKSAEIKTLTGQNHIALLTVLRKRKTGLPGFTLVELLICIAIMGTLAGMAMMGYNKLMTQVRNTRAISELRNIEKHIDFYFQENEMLPETLDDLDMGPFIDPWGNPYQYQDLEIAGIGKARKLYGMVPLNTDYDLWSLGPDGKSVSAITAAASHDDIVRVNNGDYIGVASQY